MLYTQSGCCEDDLLGSALHWVNTHSEFCSADSILSIALGKRPELLRLLQLWRSGEAPWSIWAAAEANRQHVLGWGGYEWEVSWHSTWCLCNGCHGRQRVPQEICWQVSGSGDVPARHGKGGWVGDADNLSHVNDPARWQACLPGCPAPYVALCCCWMMSAVVSVLSRLRTWLCSFSETLKLLVRSLRPWSGQMRWTSTSATFHHPWRARSRWGDWACMEPKIVNTLQTICLWELAGSLSRG